MTATNAYAPTAGLATFRNEWGLGRGGVETTTALDALQALLDHLSPERGYRLSFVPDGTAATSFASKQVIVTSAALGLTSGAVDRDGGVIGSEGWSVTAGFIAHEVSHIRYGRTTADAVDAAFPAQHPDHALAHACSNLLDDLRIEARFADDFPGFGAIFGDVRRWVAQRPESRQVYERIANTPSANLTADDVYNAVIGHTRLFWSSWVARDVGIWSNGWAATYIVDDTVDLHLRGVQALIDYLRTFGKTTPPPPPTNPGKGQGGQGEPKPGEQPTGPTQPGEGKGEPGDDGGEPGSNGTPTDGEPGSDGEPKPGEGKGQGQPSGGDGGDADDSGERNPGGDPSAKPGKGGTGSAGDESPTVSPEALNAMPSLDAINGKSDRSDRIAQQRLDRHRADNTATPGEAFSHAPVTVTLRGDGQQKRQAVRASLGDSAAIRAAFDQTRLSHDEWGGGFTTGRFRSRDAGRAGSGDLNVFSRRVNPSATKVHLALLVDWSGSMSSREAYCDAFVQQVAEAMRGVETFRLSVWFYQNGLGGARVTKSWGTGEGDVHDALETMRTPGGGTPTAESLDGLCSVLEADQRVDERTLVLSLTDGGPAVPAEVRSTVDFWSERGITTLGVYVSTGGDLDDMREQYGDERVVWFDGSWNHLAEDLAEAVAKAMVGAI